MDLKSAATGVLCMKLITRRVGQLVKSCCTTVLLAAGMILGVVAAIPAYAQSDNAYSRSTTPTPGMTDWMRTISGDVRLKDLSIPGTHDSMSYQGDFWFTVSDLWSRTQTKSLAGQLDSGIRALDIRCRRVNNLCVMQHGPIYLNNKLEDVLTIITNFLKIHREETVLIRIKEEFSPFNSNLTTQQIIANYVANPMWKDYIWLDHNANAKLGEVRGQIVILRGYTSSINDVGIAYNNAQDFNIQDNYTVNSPLDVSSKWVAIKNLFERVRTTPVPSSTFFINYLSGSGNFAPPSLVAATTNSFANTYTQAVRPRSVGIVMADFPGDSLISNIVRLNSSSTTANCVTLFDTLNYGIVQGGFSGTKFKLFNGKRMDVGKMRLNMNSLTIGNDAVRSMVVNTGCKVTLYTAANYGENSIQYTAGSYPSLGPFNGVTSSLIVEKN